LRRLGPKTPFSIKFKRGEVLRIISDDEKKVFDNFLRKMSGLGVIVRDVEGGPGTYRFPNLLHYLYFWMEAARAKSKLTT
jgi:hypothetical protein